MDDGRSVRLILPVEVSADASWWWRALAYTVPFVLVAAVLATILALNHGRFVYALDDVYIHLAMAENLLRGSYGVNLGEAASASSSPLYPWLLAGTLLGGLGDYGPLALNLVALACLLTLVCWYAQRLLPDARGAVVAGFTVLVVALANGIGLVFLGMEHELHLLASAAVVIGLIRALETGRPGPWFLYAGIVLGPLLRFEGLAVSGAAVLVLHLRQRDLQAWAALATALVVLAVNMTAFDAMGLPLLPMSVLTKSMLGAHLVTDGGALGAVANHVARSLLLAVQEPVAWCLVLGVLVCAGRARRPWLGSTEGAVTLFAALAVAAHLLAGRFGWQSRYEPYIVITALLSASYCLRAPLRRVVPWRRLEGGLAGAVLAILLATYGATLAKTPLAANNVYEMAYTTHRFLVEEHRAPVAVNDLGLASYRNDAYVLDVYGLGNNEARQEWLSGRMHAWLAEATARHGIDLAVLYQGWYGSLLPDNWREVAVLSLSRQRVSPAESAYHFYATSATAVPALAAELCRFAGTLPDGPRLTLRQPCP